MSLPGELIQALAHTYRQDGWRPTLRMAVQFLIFPLFEYRRGYLVRRTLKEPIHIRPPKLPVTIRALTLEDEPLLMTVLPRLRVRRIIHKLREGEIGAIAIHDGRVVGYCFGGFADTPSTRETHLELGPKEAYAWGGYVIPAYRRQGVWGAVHLVLCQMQQTMGYETCYGVVDVHNPAPLGALRKIGFDAPKRMTVFRILKWKRVRWEPVEEAEAKR